MRNMIFVLFLIVTTVTRTTGGRNVYYDNENNVCYDAFWRWKSKYVDICPYSKIAPKYAFVTLVANDEYAIGAAVLAESILQTKTIADLVAIVIVNDNNNNDNNNNNNDDNNDFGTKEELFVSKHNIELLVRAGWKVMGISKKAAFRCPLLEGNILIPRYIYTCEKLRVWSLTDYDVVIYVDADQIFYKNIDYLFETMLPGLDFRAIQAPYDFSEEDSDPNLFSSALMIIRPNFETVRNMYRFISKIDYGDLYIINVYYQKQAISQDFLFDHKEWILGSQTWGILPPEGGFEGFSVFDFAGSPSHKPWATSNAELTHPMSLWGVHKKWNYFKYLLEKRLAASMKQKSKKQQLTFV